MKKNNDKNNENKYQSQSLSRYKTEKPTPRQSVKRVETPRQSNKSHSNIRTYKPPIRQSKRAPIKQNKSKLDRITLKKRILIGTLAVASCLVGSLFLGLMYRYSVISELKYDINTINRELDEISNQKKEIQVQLEHSNRSDIIEKIAMEQLGMFYPSDENIVYIEID